MSYLGLLGQAGTGAGAATTSPAMTVGAGGTISSAAAGSLVLVAFCLNTNVTVSSVTDSHSNTYTVLPGLFGSGTSFSGIYLAASKLTAGLASGDTITGTLSGASKFNMAAQAFSGATATQDGTVVTNTGSTFGTAWGAGPRTTTNAADILISAGSNYQTTPTDTPTAGWTDDLVLNDSGGGTLFLQHQIVASTGSYTGGGTVNAANNTVSLIVAFQAAGGAAALAAPVVSQAVNRSLFY